MTTYDALADPTRRAILDRLRTDGPLSLTEVAEPYEMTRQAVTKHLDALAESGLVIVRRRGRERLHELDVTPLMAVREWLEPYAREWDRRLERLRAHVETNERSEDGRDRAED